MAESVPTGLHRDMRSGLGRPTVFLTSYIDVSQIRQTEKMGAYTSVRNDVRTRLESSQPFIMGLDCRVRPDQETQDCDMDLLTARSE